jgi:hypothetical protein
MTEQTVTELNLPLGSGFSLYSGNDVSTDVFICVLFETRGSSLAFGVTFLFIVAIVNGAWWKYLLFSGALPSVDLSVTWS